MKFDPKEFRGGTAGILGLGRSGLACARLLGRRGFKVFASDSRPRSELKAALGRLASAASWEGGGHSERLLRCAFVVKSPGLKPTLPVLALLRDAGVPVFSELEVALAFSKAREVVAVTGTNGKTTTTALAAEMFRRGLGRGRKALVCGNIGLPISAVAPAAGPKDVLVMEVSSYQLEDSRYFKPSSAAILNITPDHLDHHGGMPRYIEAKAAVFRDQTPEDACVFNAGDPLTLKLSRRCPSRRLYFGGPGHVQARFEEGRIQVSLPGAKDFSLLSPALPGGHNVENAMAAALLALSRGIKPAAVREAFKAFKGVEHRIEEAGVFRGIRCVNDSKATNVDSTLVALKAFSEAGKRLFLILGGLHKGSPYTPLRPHLEALVKGVLTIGSAARKIEEDLAGASAIFPCGDLETAVRTAFQIASRGDILLLSPACASFDQFRDFEDRGRRFKSLVRSLA